MSFRDLKIKRSYHLGAGSRAPLREHSAVRRRLCLFPSPT
jgi:hypothetical protein